MKWNVFKINRDSGLDSRVFSMISEREYEYLAIDELSPLKFNEVLKNLSSRDILRSDFHITPQEIEYKNVLSSRVDKIISTDDGVIFEGQNLESPLVYLLYRNGKIFFKTEKDEIKHF